MIINELSTIIDRAKDAEVSSNFFNAAIYYKEALEIAVRNSDSVNIKMCKNKVVEMNNKSLASGKDFQEHEFIYELTEEQQTSLREFIVGILKLRDISKILKTIGQHSDFMPKVTDVDNLAKRSIPVAYQIATLNTVSDNGHNLRGSSDASYSWFMQMYDLSQKQILNLCLCRLMYMLINDNPVGETVRKEEFINYFSQSKLIDPSHLNIITMGLTRYLEKDYVSALHILVPQFESFLLSIASGFGINIIALDTSKDIATRTVTLSERDMESDGFKKIFGDDFCRQMKFVLFEPMGYKLRHKIAHGEINLNECNFQNATLIVYLYLALLARIRVK